MARPKKKSNVGRPTIFNEVTLQKLEQGFKIGLTDTEACAYADIAPASLYNYQKENPEYLEQKNKWKQNPIAKAKYTIFNNLDDVKTAQWYLEKKCGNEFCGNQINNIVNVNNTQGIQINKTDIEEVINGINQLTDEL